MITSAQRDQLRQAFRAGELRVQSVSSGGVLEWRQVQAVHRADVRPESIWELTTKFGSSVFTGGHRVYRSPNPDLAVDAETLVPGDSVLVVWEGEVRVTPLISVLQIDDRQFMFDLTVEGNHNLILTTSCICSHNSPDRNYHFRPPEHECDIGQYNRIFGYVWTDEELKVYLDQALRWWNMMPPRTGISDLNCLLRGNSDWSMAVNYAAMSHALMALAINWVHEEFDYSIGGVSLSIDKSSKYESLKSNAEGQFDKAAEAKARTVKFIRGLQQPRYGIGIRSAFGPAVGKGILSPRNFLVFLGTVIGGSTLITEVLSHAHSLSSLLS